MLLYGYAHAQLYPLVQEDMAGEIAQGACAIVAQNAIMAEAGAEQGYIIFDGDATRNVGSQMDDAAPSNAATRAHHSVPANYGFRRLQTVTKRALNKNAFGDRVAKAAQEADFFPRILPVDR